MTSDLPTIGDKVYVKKNHEVELCEWSKKVGDWCCCDSETMVANGEFGYVVGIVSEPDGNKTKDYLVVRMEAPDRHVRIERNRNLVDFGYATTVHKSQGSEWPIVIYVADRSCGRIGSRQLVYTAISRAKQLCFTVGQLDVINQQIRRDVIKERTTFLWKLLDEME